jgi:hypothetical protein
MPCCCAHWARVSACAKPTVHYGDSADNRAKSGGLQLHLSTPAYFFSIRLHRVALVLNFVTCWTVPVCATRAAESGWNRRLRCAHLVVSNNIRNTLNNIAMDEGHSALAEVTARMSTDGRDTQAIEGGSRRAAGVTAAASASVATATPTAADAAAAAAASSPSTSDVSAAAVVVAAVSSVATAISTLSSPTKKRKTDDTFAMFTSPEAAGRGPSAAVTDGDGASQPSSGKRGRTAKQQAFDPNRSNFGGFGDYMAHKNAGVRQRQAVTAPARESDIFAGVVVHVNGDTRPLSKVRSCATHCTTDDRSHL